MGTLHLWDGNSCRQGWAEKLGAVQVGYKTGSKRATTEPSWGLVVAVEASTLCKVPAWHVPQSRISPCRGRAEPSGIMAGQMWSLTLTAGSQETPVISPSALLASLWLFPGLQGALLPQGGHTGPMTIKLNLSKKKCRDTCHREMPNSPISTPR